MWVKIKKSNCVKVAFNHLNQFLSEFEKNFNLILSIYTDLMRPIERGSKLFRFTFHVSPIYLKVKNGSQGHFQVKVNNNNKCIK